MAVAIVKYYDFTGSAAVAGSNFRIAAVTYLDNLGVSNNFLGPIDLSDAAATTAYFEAFIDGLIRYAASSGNQSFVLRGTVYRLTELNLLYNDTNGDPQFVLIPLTEDRNRYEHDVNIVRGCLDSDAENYNSLATESDGSCVYEAISPEDLLRKMVNAYNLEKTKRGLIGSEGNCCCDSVKGRFLNRVVEISQRIVNNTTEIAAEVRATAEIDFSSFDFGTLQNQMTIDIIITFEDGTTLTLTSFTGDYYGMSSTAFLTAVALNINLDSPDFSAVYPGAGLIIDIVAAPDYGEDINLAIISLNFVDVLALGALHKEVDASDTYARGTPIRFGNYLYFARANGILRVDPTGVEASVAYSFFSGLIFIPTIGDSCGYATSGYKSYQEKFVSLSYATSCPHVHILRNSIGIGSLDNIIFSMDNVNRIHTIMTSGSMSVSNVSLSFNPTGFAVRDNGDYPAKLYFVDTSVTPAEIETTLFGGIGLFATPTNLGTEAAFTATSSVPGIVYNVVDDMYYVVCQNVLVRINAATDLVDNSTTLSGTNREIITIDPIDGSVYLSCATVAGQTGSTSILKCDSSFVITTAATLAFNATGRIGVKPAALVADVRYYVCEYNSNTVHVLDGSWVEVDTITVQTKSALSTYLTGCIYDADNDLLLVHESTTVNLAGSPAVITVVVNPTTKLIQNTLSPNGNGKAENRGGYNLDIVNGIVANKEYLDKVRTYTFLDRSTIIGQLIFTGSDGAQPKRGIYVDVLPDYSLVDSGFSLLTENVIKYKYNSILDKIIGIPSAGDYIQYFDKNQTGYLQCFLSATAASFCISTGTGLLGITDPVALAISGITGKYAVAGTPYAGGVISEFIYYTATVYTEKDTTAEFDSIDALGFDTTNNRIIVGGYKGVDYVVATYSDALALVSSVTILGGLSGTGRIVYDPINRKILLHEFSQNKVYVLDEDAVVLGMLDLAAFYATDLSGGYFDYSLQYWANGVSYGHIYYPADAQLVIFKIEGVDVTPAQALGTFDEGLDAILQTEEDECLTFEENDSLVEKARQLVISCIRNER